MVDQSPCYSIDTSALIDWWEDYPPDIFLGLLPLMEKLVSEGRLRAVRPIRDEIQDSTEEKTLAKWCQAQSGFYVHEREEVQKAVTKIMTQFQTPKKTKGISGADPFVIAQALLGGDMWHVVSSENPANGNAHKNPNIPFVCKEISVDHLRFVDMLRKEGWQLS